MQFITNGPDIPDALLQAQEEGRVVFFCGAGISYPAGLPGFKGLVDAVYTRVGTHPDAIEQEAYDSGHYDATLDLLERRLPGQRIAVRTALSDVLQPKLRRKHAADTHSALLELAQSRQGVLRLVTTNFDRVFEHVRTRMREPLEAFAAPMLPIPKNSRWNGLVYLHGLLPQKPSEAALNRLVITSGDFGLAYLTERWAARFVSELFRHYVVCFVGYSINDPVLRYMMDALAADRMLGELTPQAYALGDCPPGEEEQKTVEWGAKGVTPVLYDPARGHAALHATIKAWAETWRNGVLGKEQIVINYAIARPAASTKQDDFVGRMVWALSHESGLPAKRFADFNPVPWIDWLDPLTENRYRYADLPRFGVPAHAIVDEDLKFSLTARPTPYTLAPRMALVAGGPTAVSWDEPMAHLARWLTRHLNDPKLILWAAQFGGYLHPQFGQMVESRLKEIADLEQSSKTAELEEMRSNSPNSIPGPLARALWRLLVGGRVKSRWGDADLYGWRGTLRRHGLTATARLELRELLTPKIALKKRHRWGDENDSADDPNGSVRQFVEWELSLAADHPRSALGDVSGREWRQALPRLLPDLQQLLRDALDIRHELGEADRFRDGTYLDLPSISPHRQNRGYREWVVLIELLRDAWLAVLRADPEEAARIAGTWFKQPYPVFKRLALFAASRKPGVVRDEWVDWLLTDGAWWVWSVETQRETMRLFVLQGRRLGTKALRRLEGAILTGPPRKMFRKGIEPARWANLVEHSIWLHLAKLKSSGARLSLRATKALRSISAANPTLRLAKNQSDEFSFWMTGSGDAEYEKRREVDVAPRKWRELVKWLKKPRPKGRPFYGDTWRQRCRDRFFASLYALCFLATEGTRPIERWREALQVWSEDDQVLRSWRFAAPVVQSLPDELLADLAHSVTWWLEKASTHTDPNELIFFDLVGRMLAMPLEERDQDDAERPVTRAINHPVGLITQALLNRWLKEKPNDNEGLAAAIEPYFTALCDRNMVQYRHGRVLLAAHLITLFRVDRNWTEANLLPLLDWQADAAEARAAWEGFLWSPRVYAPLMDAFKPHFLVTAQHYSDLGEHSRQFAAFLTYAALYRTDDYTVQEYQAAIQALPKEGLAEAAETLQQALESAGERREDYWRTRVQPFWKHVWPKSRDLASSGIAESLARLSIAAGGEFP